MHTPEFHEPVRIRSGVRVYIELSYSTAAAATILNVRPLGNGYVNAPIVDVELAAQEFLGGPWRNTQSNKRKLGNLNI